MINISAYDLSVKIFMNTEKLWAIPPGLPATLFVTP
jgi:hypothetical protein